MSEAWIAAPAETPTRSPSRSAVCLAVVSASSSPTGITSSITERSRTSGTKPGPMPWILCGPGSPPASTAEVSGSTATTRTPGRRSFSTWPTPVIVPPVPTPQTSASTSPSRSRQISSAVVVRWTSGFAGLENCWGMKPSRSATMRRASSTASLMPPSEGVSWTSAP